MTYFRSRLLTALLFLLVSIGQGFSFSYLYRFSQVDLVGSSREGLQETPYLVCHGKSQQSVGEKPFPTRSHEEILGFRSEPFLPSLISFADPSFKISVLSEMILELSPVSLPPETPPPRSSESLS